MPRYVIEAGVHGLVWWLEGSVLTFHSAWAAHRDARRRITPGIEVWVRDTATGEHWMRKPAVLPVG